MLSYCLKCKKNTESINPRVSKTINGKRKSEFIKEQQAKVLLSNLGTRTPLNKIPIVRRYFVLIKCNTVECNSIV